MELIYDDGRKMMILKNCRFIGELTEGEIERGDVLIKDGYIVKVAEKIEMREESVEMDLSGMFVVPGFIDLHVHLSTSGGDVLYDNQKDDYYMCMQAYKSALDSLRAGFTTLRDVGSNNRMVNGIRDYIEAGGLMGPRIISSGKILTPSENGNDYFEKMYVECDGLHEVVKGVRKELKEGADFIKVMASGAIMNPGGDPGTPIYTDSELREIVDTARVKGRYVAAHAHSAEAIKQCFRCGVATVEHASIMDDECIELALSSEATRIVPTVTAFMDMVEEGNAEAQFINEKIERFAGEFVRTHKKAYEAGVIMGFGTDQGVTGSYHGKNGNEFLYRKEVIGMENLDILKQATINNAEIAGIAEVTGSIEAGKTADLVVLSEDPLKDIKACSDSIKYIISRGRLVAV